MSANTEFFKRRLRSIQANARKRTSYSSQIEDQLSSLHYDRAEMFRLIIRLVKFANDAASGTERSILETDDLISAAQVYAKVTALIDKKTSALRAMEARESAAAKRRSYK